MAAPSHTRSISSASHEDTEAAFSRPLLDEHRKGVFACAGCELPLFKSETKFESGTGWPSFWSPIEGAVGTKTDRSFWMDRTEVHCRRCGGHLGHVFSATSLTTARHRPACATA
jgi:peptide-methionine (R)-S-oxide reductase